MGARRRGGACGSDACGSGVHAAKGRSKELRKGRVSESGRTYVITATTHGRRRIFGDLPCGRAVVGAMRHHDRIGNTETLAFVVMPDHAHWLLTLTGQSPLDAVLHSMKSYSAKIINGLANASGRIWQPGYHDRALRRDEDLRAVARYVIANPLRAGLVERIGDYPLWDATWP